MATANSVNAVYIAVETKDGNVTMIHMPDPKRWEFEQEYSVVTTEFRGRQQKARGAEVTIKLSVTGMRLEGRYNPFHEPDEPRQLPAPKRRLGTSKR